MCHDLSHGIMDEIRSSRYEIRVQGHLAARRLDCFEVSITQHPDGETSLVGVFSDQSALYGLLNHIRNLGVTLLSVNRVAETNGQESAK